MFFFSNQASIDRSKYSFFPISWITHNKAVHCSSPGLFFVNSEIVYFLTNYIVKILFCGSLHEYQRIQIFFYFDMLLALKPAIFLVHGLYGLSFRRRNLIYFILFSWRNLRHFFYQLKTWLVESLQVNRLMPFLFFFLFNYYSLNSFRFYCKLSNGPEIGSYWS